jgi:hypothetical protein
MSPLLSKEERIAIASQYGIAPESVDEWYLKWRRHVNHARNRGVLSNLSFSDYVSTALASGLVSPEQISKQEGGFVLGRIGDVGNYSLGTCRFISQQQNIQEAYDNGRHADGIATRSEHFKGKTLATGDERCRKISESLKGRTKESSPGVAATAFSNSKNFVVTDPQGNVYRGRNMIDFCNEHPELKSNGMSKVCRGALPHYKGWTGTYLKEGE